jgi:hypothetical protein
MNIIFPKTNAYWAKYSEYEYKKGDDGHLYLRPKPDAQPEVYDPMKVAETLVVDALNVGRLAMKRGKEKKLKLAIMEFVTKYGLLGFMTALPTTPEFVDYDAVYLPKNHFVRQETLSAQDYIARFFPFDKPDFHKDSRTSGFHVRVDPKDRKLAALAMTFSSQPIAVGMSLQRSYVERYDWLATQFRDWAFMLVSSFLYYEDKAVADDFTLDLYRQGVTAFGGKAPTYHVALYDDKPTIVWDFHSLLLTIQTLFGFALTDEAKLLRLCNGCNMVFIGDKPNAEFCSSECENSEDE